MVQSLPAADTIPADINHYGFNTIPDVLTYICREYGPKPAYTSFGRTLDFNELDRLSAAFAVYLQKETQLQPGDRVAIQLPNLIQYPVVLYGALRAGLVVVNTNPLYTAKEMEHQFRDSGAKALIIHKSMAHNAEKIIDNTDIQDVFVTQVGDLHGFVKRNFLNAAVKYLKKMEPSFSLPDAIPLRSALLKYLGETPHNVSISSSDVAVLQYTGGTTGVSKGAVLTHANLISNMLQAEERLTVPGVDWTETVISPLPLYHIYAFTVAQVVSLLGGHSVLIPNPRDIPGFIKELGKWNMSTFVGLNTLFVALCNDQRFLNVDFSNLKFTASGGMALTHAAADLWKEKTGCEIIEGYGLTETSPAVCFNPPDANSIGTVGLPMLHTDIRIIDADGNDAQTGEPGELCVKGPQVMKGYWNRKAETASAFTDDGYFITGDIAMIDEKGYYRIVDRVKDMIIVSGFNVYPNEIEDILAEHPDITECAVIGVPDPKAGEVVKAFIVSHDSGLKSEDVQQWCKARLTGYKVPKQVEFVEDLPKSNVGKVLRRLLKTPDKDVA
ncbi:MULTISPECIES: AMP-binding protein [unclassified Neptuniibacter]|uniref:AMP-binding protein n=1 Tax=unclassified Neptuniibacter TaxID=2630693 RepID=UPI000C50BC5E|nr:MULTISPECIES: AMP-binding protein [unclassified Neptuniibacter]MAY42249.1 long-chain fatty acid--CoA ligase [Oceanospirillaceae bacterium]|tara:strand:- start:6045 stop:7709 length:1665 start_codon:yes stop_codon:yes gene_type:complete